LAVQPHLKKVFENINEVTFDKDKKILSMLSAEKEEIGFVKHVDPNKKNVEDWMGELENMMKMSVRQSMLNSIEDYPKKKRSEWSISHPGQVVLNGSQIIWTGDV
jgi:dynein heavy chain